MGRCVLVMEDDRAIRSLLHDILADEGYEVREAENGEGGLETLARWPVDLVILDIGMPLLDGFDFRRRQQEMRLKPEVPVIVLSARPEFDPSDLQASEIIRKPFDVEALLEVVARLLGAGVPEDEA